MANSEDSLVDELREQFKKSRPMAWVIKLHGGPMQPGLPDLIVAGERHAAMVEAKWAQDADFEKPLLEACAAKLTDAQAVNLHDLGVLDGPLRARILIGGEVEAEALPRGKGVVVVAFDVCDLPKLREFVSLTLMELTLYLLDLRAGEKVTLACSHLLQMQLRAPGETWEARHLLAGRQYAGPDGPLNPLKDKEKTFEDA